MRRTCMILGVILILVNTGYASYTPEEEKACSKLVTSTKSFVHAISGTVYILYGSKQHRIYDLDSMNKHCFFIKKDTNGNLHLLCGSPVAVDSTCVKKLRNDLELKKLRNDLEKAQQQLKND